MKNKQIFIIMLGYVWGSYCGISFDLKGLRPEHFHQMVVTTSQSEAGSKNSKVLLGLFSEIVSGTQLKPEKQIYLFGIIKSYERNSTISDVLNETRRQYPYKYDSLETEYEKSTFLVMN